MQEFNAQPQMISPYTPAGGGNMPSMPSAPALGTPIPGTTGGLPAKPGLSVFQNPMASQFQSSPQNFAQQTQSYGRGDDSMLVHMTPDEVGGLQALAMAHGGSLTINPHTGLPEAGFLGKILPTLLGALGAAVGLPTWALALGGTAVGTAVSGDLGKGLMAGLGAWGGASLAGGLGLGKAGEAAMKGATLGTDAPTQLVGTTAQQGATALPAAVAGQSAGLTSALANTAAAGGAGAGAAGVGAGAANLAGQAASKAPGLIDRFSAASRFQGVGKAPLGGFLGKAAPYAAGLGLVNTVSELAAPNLPKYEEEENKWHYAPLRKPPKREVSFQTPEQMRESGGAEFTYFPDSNPFPGYALDQTMDETNRGYADGGLAALETPEGFNDLVSYFGASSPGAITASRTYPTPAATAATGKGGTAVTGENPTNDPSYANYPAAQQGEKTYTFTNPQKTASNTSSSTRAIPGKGAVADGTGSADTSGYSTYIPGVGGINIPNMSADDIQALIAQNQAGAGAGAGAATTMGTQATPTLESQKPGFSDLDEQTRNFILEQEALSRAGTAGIIMPTGTSGQATQQPTPAQQLNAFRNPQGNEPSTRQLTPAAAPASSMAIPGMDGFQLPDFSKMDYSQYTQPSATVPPASEVQAPPSFDYSQYMPDYYNYQYAGGGDVNMRNGSFVVDARTVSELGNGSSNAGMDLLSRMGGQPVRGPGDGVSDSVRARIGGRQEARVARDEVIMPPQAVARLGGGSQKRGTQKLYALMDKAHKARKRAGRGTDTKLAKGLGAIA